LLEDLLSIWMSGRASWDRGREIERIWAQNSLGADNLSPFQRPFLALKDLEREGSRPSLIFSPMLVEDARRLLISNLDLLDLTWTFGDVCNFSSFKDYSGIRDSPDRPGYSIGAVELFRLFPGLEAKFEVGTAARMNASFPWVSPGVSLPTDPPRRVVDAGYYDNYGVDLAARWLYRHESEIREYTSGVALIEIRAYRNGYARWHFQDKEKEVAQPDPGMHEDGIPPSPGRVPDAATTMLTWLSTPMEAMMNARDRG